MTSRPGPKFNRAQRTELFKQLKNLLRDKNYSVKDAATELGISVNYVYRIAKKYDYPLNSVNKRKISNVIESKENGFNSKELAGLYRISEGEVEKIINHSAGYTRKTTVELPKEHSHMG